jgi:hypothetical protein
VGLQNSDSGCDLPFPGVPHVWYQDLSNLDVRHAWWTGAAWRFETLDGAGGFAGRTTGSVSAATLYRGLPRVGAVALSDRKGS